MTKFTGLLAGCIVLLLVAGSLRTSQTAGEPRLPGALFAETAPFEMEMRLEYGKTCLNTTRNCPAVPAEIVYRKADGSERHLTVTVRTRGRWLTAGCRFPALFVFFTPDQARGTVFEGEKMLPLTTHCTNYGKQYEGYVLLEYLAHRLYRLLTDVSLHARLAHITYVFTDKDRSLQRYGFFTEHFERLAERTGKTYYQVKPLDMYSTIPQEMATLALFQFMVGNLDWSAYASHNIAQFRSPDGLTTPVPYDFDYSGLINAEYAVPPDFLRGRSIRYRRYRGFCWPGLDWLALFRQFQLLRGPVFAELSAIPGLHPKARKDAEKYLKSFYGIINSGKSRQRLIIEACRNIPAPGSIADQ